MKSIFKKVSAVALTLALGMSMVACGGNDASNESGAKFKAGTYTTKVTGMNEMTISVTVSDTEITDIKVEHTETDNIGAPVVEDFSAKIKEIQGLGLDTVAGATLTSNAMLDGVADCLKQAGADVDALKAIKG